MNICLTLYSVVIDTDFITNRLMDYFIVLIFSSLKFMVGVATAILRGFSFWEQVLITSLGGILGVIIFAYFGEKIRTWFNKKRKKKQKELKEWHIKLWNKLGLIGTAFLTPPILSPPIGVAIALAFGTKPSKIVLYNALSMIFWSFFFAYFGMLDVKELIEKLL